VRLDQTHPDDWDDIVLGVGKRGIDFVCPVCRAKFRNDASNLPPLCTGPHSSLDEHPLAEMVRAD